MLDGLLKEKYTLYISGDNIATSTLEVKASASGEEVLIIADRPTVGLKGQVFWADTEEPVRNALVSRSWYPWELTPYDLSLTLDRFKTKTDAQGNFAFSNMTQERYQLHQRHSIVDVCPYKRECFFRFCCKIAECRSNDCVSRSAQ